MKCHINSLNYNLLKCNISEAMGSAKTVTGPVRAVRLVNAGMFGHNFGRLKNRAIEMVKAV